MCVRMIYLRTIYTMLASALPENELFSPENSPPISDIRMYVSAWTVPLDLCIKEDYIHSS